MDPLMADREVKHRLRTDENGKKRMETSWKKDVTSFRRLRRISEAWTSMMQAPQSLTLVANSECKFVETF